MRSAIVAVILVLSARAYADDVTTADEKFDKAVELREHGDVAQACTLFTASLALNPNAIGTILNVARCAEEANHVATAIRYFSDARDRAREQSLAPQLEAATQHLTTLTPRVSHLALAFTETYTADARIVVQERVVAVADASDILVDAGPVKIVISEPGRVPYQTTITLAEAEHKAVAVPALGYPVTVHNSTSRRTFGKLMVGVGGAALATSVILGYLGHTRWVDATRGCPYVDGAQFCPEDQYLRANRAITLGNVGTGFACAAAAFVVGGAALWYFSPNAREDHLAVVPVVTPSEAGLAAIARF